MGVREWLGDEWRSMDVGSRTYLIISGGSWCHDRVNLPLYALLVEIRDIVDDVLIELIARNDEGTRMNGQLGGKRSAPLPMAGSVTKGALWDAKVTSTTPDPVTAHTPVPTHGPSSATSHAVSSTALDNSNNGTAVHQGTAHKVLRLCFQEGMLNSWLAIPPHCFDASPRHGKRSSLSNTQHSHPPPSQHQRPTFRPPHGKSP